MKLFTLLRPYLALYRHYFFSIVLGMVLVVLALAASIFLLSLSGWFLAMTAVVGVAGLYTFNYMMPATGVRGAAIFRTVSRYFERLVNHNITFKILAALRVAAFKKLLPLSQFQLSHYQKGDLLNRFIADIDHLDHLYLRLFTPILSGLIVTVMIYLGLMMFNSTLAALFTLTLLCAILVLPFMFYHAGRSLGERITLLQAQYRQQMIDYLDHQSELILFHAQSRVRVELDRIETEWLQQQRQQQRLVSLATSLVLLISGALVVVTFLLLSDHLPLDHRPLLAIFVFIALSIAEILTPISTSFIFLGQVVQSAIRMNALYDTTTDIVFPEQGPSAQSTITVELKDLSFHYPSHDSLILNQVNITVQAGARLALIGQTGVGKSTLLRLLTRDWSPTQGAICFNGINICEFDEPTLRSMISVVPQTIYLFNDTLRHNLLMAKPEASDDELIAMLKQMKLEKLLDTEEGLSLMIGEKGRSLSGGERRRIGIARALLHDAPLLLLDEPTESLDRENEQMILTILDRYHQQKTVIMVTHRLDHLNRFDHIMTLKQGELVAESMLK